MIRKIVNFYITRYKSHGNANLIALMIYLYLILYNKRLIDKKSKYFLSFEKSRFNLDIDAMKEFSSVKILKFPLNLSTTLGENFLPKFLRHQINYHRTNDPIYIEAKNNYYDFTYKVIKNLSSKFNVGGLIVGNFDYWEHQEWSRASQKFKIPTFCLYRESYGWDAKIFWRTNLYNQHLNPIPKMEVCVFGSQAKQWLKDLPILSDSNFHITGSPRTDYHFFNHKNKNTKNSKNLIVLFDYFGQNYGDNVEICSHHKFEFVDNNTKFCLMCNKNFYDISAEVTKKFISISKLAELENYKFIIKTKESYYSDQINATFKSDLEKSNNVHVTSSLDFKNILLDSKVIIGSFRSTAIAESFISDASIVLPYWDKPINPALEGLDNYENLNLYKITQMEDFNNIVLDIIKNNKHTSNEVVSKRLELINELLYKIDGFSSRRFEKVLSDTKA